jgi:hypothetical protein
VLFLLDVTGLLAPHVGFVATANGGDTAPLQLAPDIVAFGPAFEIVNNLGT